jgi:lipopolysaccharide/colanic/teichoic acid biosynthesis glycosyltransferase
MERPLAHISPESGIRDASSFNCVHSGREFASILNRERDRADRTGQEFSMIVYEVGTDNGKSSAARHLVSILTNRVRSTDEIGWLEDGRIGVILPHTLPDGAGKFVTNVRQSYNGGPPPPDCRVYVYPSGWISGANGGSAPRSRAVKRIPSTEETDASAKLSSNVEAADNIRPVEELDAQFLCRIPFWKRAIDIVGTILALILLTPLLLLVALLIKVVSPGPILFRQERVGYMGRLFTIRKFRTMHVNADTTVHQQYLRELINDGKEMTKLDNGNDDRIIPFGKILRATGIDELPQLINVLLGDMSLVGPRPCLPYEASEYHSWQTRRFDAVPGLTGLWQVSGKNRTTFKEMMRLDIAYTKKRALLLDAKIFLMTIPAIIDQVVDRKGYAHAGSPPKRLSFAEKIVIQVGVVLLAILMLNMLHK